VRARRLLPARSATLELGRAPSVMMLALALTALAGPTLVITNHWPSAGEARERRVEAWPKDQRLVRLKRWS